VEEPITTNTQNTSLKARSALRLSLKRYAVAFAAVVAPGEHRRVGEQQDRDREHAGEPRDHRPERVGGECDALGASCWYTPVMTMTSAVMVQMTTVSMKGSSSATYPR
jgi:hypothetical protein